LLALDAVICSRSKSRWTLDLRWMSIRFFHAPDLRGQDRATSSPRCASREREGPDVDVANAAGRRSGGHAPPLAQARVVS